MGMLEAEVHSSLRGFLRERKKPLWNHHLTMARLVSRALRLQRSALIQTGSTASRYSISYLTPALLSDESLLLVTPTSLQQQLLEVEIPQLQHWLAADKKIYTEKDCLDSKVVSGLILASPQAWLADRLENKGYFPAGIPTLIDEADNLEEWTRQFLTVTIAAGDWESLMQDYPQQAEAVRDIRFQLSQAVFDRPRNPYNCYMLEQPERQILERLWQIIPPDSLSQPSFHRFWQRSRLEGQLLWASLSDRSGQVSMAISPVQVGTTLKPIWEKQPVVLMGGFLDWDKSASVYQDVIGLEEILALKFSPNRQNESIQLYLPDRLPMPNTPQFQGVLLEQLRDLVRCVSCSQPIVILVEDVPLKAQVGTIMAAEFGSRVRVEKFELPTNGILITGWEFWRCHQDRLPIPQLLAIATLPIPSLENPLVASRVAYYKRQRQDWFRLYLLPTALREIQRAVMPLRESQGVVALLDNRVNYRSYGTKILAALSPYSRINYLDPSWFC